jgi:hypothetical protein
MKNPRRRGDFYLGWLMGFEPTTTGITILDSTTELQPPLIVHLSQLGLPDRDRTCDPQLRRLMLYPTELRAETLLSYLANRKNIGRGRKIRTSGLLLPKQALYQAKLYPEDLDYSAGKNSAPFNGSVDD